MDSPWSLWRGAARPSPGFSPGIPTSDSDLQDCKTIRLHLLSH